MKIDAYTKFLLTVVTLCLLYLCVKDLVIVPKVHADAPVRVLLVDENGNGIAWNGMAAIPVVVQQR